MPKPCISSEIAARITQEYVAGATADNLAEKYGVTRKVVSGAIRRRGFKMRRRGYLERDFSKQERAEIRKRWEKGTIQQDLAVQFRCSPAKIGRVLREEGLDTARTRWGRPNKGWQPRRRLGPSGYVKVKVHPSDPFARMATDKDYVSEHRLVMARHLGRLLEPYETVYHINGNKSDNRVENLQIRNGCHGKGVSLECADCGSTRIRALPLDVIESEVVEIGGR